MEGLLEIQDTVAKYVKIIAKIVKVDVEVVDSNLYRIAGTGVYAKDVNKDISNEGYVYKHVMKTRERKIIFEPGKDELCYNCPDKDNCKENFEVSTPIQFRGKILGVIGMICSDEEQKKVLQKNLSIYLEFLDQIADFIAVKAFESDQFSKNIAVVKTLNAILNEIKGGIIIFDKHGKITSINEYAKKFFNILDFDYGDKAIKIMETGDTLNNYREYKVNINERSYTVIGNMYKIDDNSDNWSSFLIFNNIKNVDYVEHEIIPSGENHSKEEIIGDSKKTWALKKEIENIANSPSTVLITGESGTGKEMVATAIWSEGNRRDKRFVTINCSSLSEVQLEMEMLGYVSDAFESTDLNGQIGKFELADKGVVYLDEIGDMPLYLQAKLIQIIEHRQITRMGSSQNIPIDVRIIASTNKDINKLIEENKFRRELYYRINIIPIKIAPLRERVEDIEELTLHFIKRYSKVFNKKFYRITDEVLKILKEYRWNGNVRELKNAVEFMVNVMDDNGIIDKKTLPKNFLQNSIGEEKHENNEIVALKELEKREILKAISIYGNTVEGKKIAAKKLGIGIATLYRKMEEFNKGN